MFVYRVMRFRPDRLTIKPIVIALTVIVVLLTTCLFVLQRNRPEAPIAVRFVGYTNSVLGRNALFRVQNPSDGSIHVGDWNWQTEDGGIATVQCYPTYGHKPVLPGQSMILPVYDLRTSQRWRLRVSYSRDRWKRRWSSWFTTKFGRKRFYQFVPVRIDGLLMDTLTGEWAISDWVGGIGGEKPLGN